MKTKLKSLPKVKHKQFVTKFEDWIESRGGYKKSPLDGFYIIDTIYGQMEISSIYITIDMYGYEVLCRFLEGINRGGKDAYDVDGYTGIWNHNIRDASISVDDAIDYMINWIEPVLIKIN